ncbi:SAM-dependent methyltransferase [Legionella israelensis]|uniref:Uncharacterized protein n=1 Tax=Legionella israelensis TaxID=454 RepID=A0A0W0V2J1_9GAMM|nr:SAM-dependent methyltransferase [Legionella israelensis]KTD14319.1 hypothetical protein Lisr_2547 [Legionella israelensis]SCY43082.1 Putative S-adenosyl-L-methionine-dependent methyltransferase [Legionella israelensis DSM 19235]STX59291.1 Uncharacterised protein [Legionella israelensis]
MAVIEQSQSHDELISEAVGKIYDLCTGNCINLNLPVSPEDIGSLRGAVIELENKHTVENDLEQKYDLFEFDSRAFPYKKLKIIRIGDNCLRGFGIATMIIKLTFLPEEKFHEASRFYLVANEDITEEISRHIVTIKENIHPFDYERNLRKSLRFRDKAVGMTTWDAKGDLAWESSLFTFDLDVSGEIYDHEIYPLMQEEIAERTSSIHKDTVVFMEIGAGKGKLAEQVIDAFLKTHPDTRLTYLLIEPGKNQCKTAKNQLFPLKKTYGSRMNLIILNKPLEALSQKWINQHRNTIDLIINCGGPLNNRVVTRDVSLKCLELLKPLLVSDGQLIASGLTYLNVTKQEFIEKGFLPLHIMNRGERFCYVYAPRNGQIVPSSKAHTNGKDEISAPSKVRSLSSLRLSIFCPPGQAKKSSRLHEIGVKLKGSAGQ